MRPLRDIGQRSALGLVGTICLLVGLAFLTVAAWIVLVAMLSMEAAALTLGLVYLGVGCMAWAFALRASPPEPKAQSPFENTSPLATMLAAFIDGLAKGYKAGQSRNAS